MVPIFGQNSSWGASRFDQNPNEGEGAFIFGQSYIHVLNVLIYVNTHIYNTFKNIEIFKSYVSKAYIFVQTPEGVGGGVLRFGQMYLE